MCVFLGLGVGFLEMGWIRGRVEGMWVEGKGWGFVGRWRWLGLRGLGRGFLCQVRG